MRWPAPWPEQLPRWARTISARWPTAALSGPVYVSSSALPFEDWRLLTAIPRSAFAAEIDRNTRRVLFVVGALALLAAATAVLFANLLFARPIRRLAGQLLQIERFSLDEVSHVPTYLAELNDFSQALKRMAGGLSAFAKYMPLDVVRPLVAGGIEPKPGGKLAEITVMFADLPGFTELTEQLGPDVEPHLTSFLTLAVAAIHAEGGTVDKFIGDAVMAIWNAPNEAPDHALRACRAARRDPRRHACDAGNHARPQRRPGQDRHQHRYGAGRQCRLGRAAELHGDRRYREPGEPAGRRRQGAWRRDRA